MKKQFLILMGIALLYFVLFTGVFSLFQRKGIYQNTLGVIAENYERVGGWDHYEIRKAAIPFVELKNDRFETWDAAIYKCISERMYVKEVECYGSVRAAFFPLFPLYWKAIGTTPIGISVINYFTFALSLALLVLLVLQTAWKYKCLIYFVLLSFPSVIIFCIPYTEALFMLTFTIAAIGLIKNNYGVFFMGCLLLAMVRPATVFVLLAILAVEVFILLKNRNYRTFIREALLKTTPFALGYFCALSIQRISSGSWTALLDAQQFWSGKLQRVEGISDWSIEGFGLSVFAVFGVCIPLLLFVLYLGVRWKKKETTEYLARVGAYNIHYLFMVSAFYLIGMFVFTVLTSGGNLHSFFRFTLASPPFYCVALVFLNYLSHRSVNQSLVAFTVMLVALLVFLNSVAYGGERLNFSFAGLYMLLATSFFLLLVQRIPLITSTVIAATVIVLNTVWNTYLLNAFLSNGWVFT